MEMYDRTRHPLEYLETFKAHITLHGFPKEITCRAFPLTLRGLARVWFRSLILGLIGSFGELVRFFLTQFMASKRKRRPEAYLLTIK